MNKPNFFIIGEPKCGTSIIHDYLSQHTNIFMSEAKEPHYFNTDHHKEAINFHGKQTASIIYEYMNENDYLKLFKDTKDFKIIGDSSTNYIYSKESAENISNFNKDSQIVYCIREPLSFLISLHGEMNKTGIENESDFKNALELENKRKKGKKIPKFTGYPSVLYYSEWIKFTEHLQRYLDYFPKEQIKVIIYEEFQKDNQKIINEITDFLGIDRMQIEYKEVNVRAKPKYPRLQRFLRSCYRIRSIAQKILPYKARKKWGNLVNKITLTKGTAPKLPEEEKTKLMKQFKPEVEKINNLLHKHNLIDPNMDLVKYWGYDKV